MLWDEMHPMSRQEICSNTAVNEEIANLPWSDVDEWLRVLLAESLSRRTHGRVTL